MVRMSKQSKIRAVSRRRPAPPAKKTGPREEAQAFKVHANALDGQSAQSSFIPKIK